jgi:hypothetical protein
MAGHCSWLPKMMTSRVKLTRMECWHGGVGQPMEGRTEGSTEGLGGLYMRGHRRGTVVADRGAGHAQARVWCALVCQPRSSTWRHSV